MAATGPGSGSSKTGWLIEHSGYPAMWMAVAASSVASGAVSIRIADRF